MTDWIKKLFQAIDEKDSEKFASFLSEDACFRFANAPAVCGKKNIQAAINQFFAGIKGLRHDVISVWAHPDIFICEGKVKYIRFDDRELTVPFVDILEMQGELIKDYRIYIDISTLA